MTFDELRTLKPEDFFRWPLQARLIISGIFVGILGLLFYFFFLQPLNEQFSALRDEEETLKTQLRDKQRLAVNLPQYQAQLDEIQRRFELMVRQLPSRAEQEGNRPERLVIHFFTSSALALAFSSASSR